MIKNENSREPRKDPYVTPEKRKQNRIVQATRSNKSQRNDGWGKLGQR